MKVHKVTRRNGDTYDVILDNEFIVDRGIHIVKSKNDKVGYAKMMVNGKDTFVHRIVLGVTDSKIKVDHKNGNTLDNRKDNLRIVTTSQNGLNRKAKGVYYNKVNKTWIATIHFNGKHTYITSNKNKEIAMKAYQKKHAELFGEFSPWKGEYK
ncbi:HNH endonuclease [Staphylococcus phage MVC_VPHSA2]|uniref:HNH endonuclease n=1 Tax=Staphylococcus phage MVC_VPHSA1 TaxID=3088876 RepID=A0ABZ0QYN9_9CAUD|nr:HNH endonuclease [Staphylococcus phage MVC_VPHSA1]WPF65024.1 HNH endonuclease [Staphylococcus phage MVC_VPHSA2]